MAYSWVNHYFIVSVINAMKGQMGRTPAIAEKPASSSLSGARRRAAGLRDSLKRFTRDQIIAAAMDSFMAVGFRATTVERIVERAGTTAPTFYRHFSSKNDLLEPLQDQLADQVRAVVDKLDRIKAIDFPTLRSWLDEYIAMWERAHRLCTAYWEAMDVDAEVATNVIPRALASVDRLPQLLGQCPPERRESLRLRLALMIPLLDRVAVVGMGQHNTQLRGQILDEFAGMLVAGLRDAFGPGPAPAEKSDQ